MLLIINDGTWDLTNERSVEDMERARECRGPARVSEGYICVEASVGWCQPPRRDVCVCVLGSSASR